MVHDPPLEINIPDEEGNSIKYLEISNDEFLSYLDGEYEAVCKLSAEFNLLEEPFKHEYDEITRIRNEDISVFDGEGKRLGYKRPTAHPWTIMSISRIKNIVKEYVKSENPLEEYDNYLNASATIFKRYQSLVDCYMAAVEEGFVYFKSETGEKVMAAQEEMLGIYGTFESLLGGSEEYKPTKLPKGNEQLYM